MEKKLLSIGEAAEMIGVSIDTLRLWEKKKILPSFRPSPESKRYYRVEDLENFLQKGSEDLFDLAENWVLGPEPLDLSKDYYCETIDVFTAGLQRLEREFSKNLELQAVSSLLVAIAGEIGNNSFNHNLGNWPDLPGTFFSYDLIKRQIVLADRGQGVLKTLRQVLPKLQSDSEALKVAFTEYISARAPEERGNGLKFVKDVVSAQNFQLKFFSGNSVLILKGKKVEMTIEPSNLSFHGCLVLINF